MPRGRNRSRRSRVPMYLRILGSLFGIAFFLYLHWPAEEDSDDSTFSEDSDDIDAVLEDFVQFDGTNLPAQFAFTKYNASKGTCLDDCYESQRCQVVAYDTNTHTKCRLYRHTPSHWGYHAYADQNSEVFIKKSLVHPGELEEDGKFYFLIKEPLTLHEASVTCEYVLDERMYHLAAVTSKSSGVTIAKAVQRISLKHETRNENVILQVIKHRSRFATESESNSSYVHELKPSSLVRVFFLVSKETSFALNISSKITGFALCQGDPLNTDPEFALSFDRYPDVHIDFDLRDVVLNRGYRDL